MSVMDDLTLDYFSNLPSGGIFTSSLPSQDKDDTPYMQHIKLADLHNYAISQERSLLFLSAGLSSCVTTVVYNPLDCLRVRWQVLSPSSPQAVEGIMHFGAQIVKHEGFVNGLWRPGVLPSAIGMGISSAMRFGYYESVRDAFRRLDYTTVGLRGALPNESTSSEHNKNVVHMALAGMTCGAMAHMFTTPFHLIKTMIQASRDGTEIGGRNNTRLHNGKNTYARSMISEFSLILKERGLVGLWRGTVPLSARGAMFGMGQMCGYDGFKTLCKSHGIEDRPSLHILSSIIAAMGATILSTPADLVMNRYMSASPDAVGSISACVKTIYIENGILGFWRGSNVFFIRLTPVMLTYTTIYEQFRHQFGLGYLS